MSEFKERRTGTDRRQAAPVQHFPILDSDGSFIEQDRRCEVDRRTDTSNTLQFIQVSEFLAHLKKKDTTR